MLAALRPFPAQAQGAAVFFQTQRPFQGFTRHAFGQFHLPGHQHPGGIAFLLQAKIGTHIHQFPAGHLKAKFQGLQRLHLFMQRQQRLQIQGAFILFPQRQRGIGLKFQGLSVLPAGHSIDRRIEAEYRFLHILPYQVTLDYRRDKLHLHRAVRRNDPGGDMTDQFSRRYRIFQGTALPGHFFTPAQNNRGAQQQAGKQFNKGKTGKCGGVK